MTNVSERTPVIVGVGQTVNHWDGKDISVAPSPLSLAVTASRAAIADTAAATPFADKIDVVAFVRLNQESYAQAPAPFGKINNMPRALAKEIGATPNRAILTPAGGQTPQSLVNEFAEAIFDSEAEIALLTGSEAIRAMKTALRASLQLDWSGEVDGDLEDRGFGTRMLNEYEIANGMVQPARAYALFENAWRNKQGLSRDQHRALIGELFAPFSEVAAQNPYAQFREARTPDYLATPSNENFELVDPYLKWHVAQDSVNQGAAVILMSVAKARELGIPESKWVYLHGYSDAYDRLVTQRRDLTKSNAMQATVNEGLSTSNRTADQIDHFEIYSCFPCAVLYACDALGIDWRQHQLTQTGGLPFFGGPGNNYSMHGIAAMVEKLRANPGDTGLVLANGGFLTKESVGVYSTNPQADWTPNRRKAAQADVDRDAEMPVFEAPTNGTVESFTAFYKKNEAYSGMITGLSNGQRFMARVGQEDMRTLQELVSGDPIGKPVTVEKTDKGNTFHLSS